MPAHPPQKTWLITGASSGLGLAIALAALHAGHRVLGTARNIEKARAQCASVLGSFYTTRDSEHVGGIEAREGLGRFLWRQLDVTQEDVGEVVRRIVEAEDVGVLVCNAGYGLYGALEDMRWVFGCCNSFPADIPHSRHEAQLDEPAELANPIRRKKHPQKAHASRTTH